VSEPVIEIRTPGHIRQQLDPEANFRERDDADIQLFKRLCSNKLNNFGSGFGRRSSDKILVSSNQSVTK